MEHHLFKLLVIVFIAFYFTGCNDSGGKSSGSPDLYGSCDGRFDIAGSWVTVDGDELALNLDCSGREDTCGIGFNWYAPAGDAVALFLVSESGISGCPSDVDRVYECEFREGEMSDSDGNRFDYISINCGAGFTNYYRSSL